MLITAQKKVPPSAGAYLLARTAAGEAEGRRGSFVGDWGRQKGAGRGGEGEGRGGEGGREREGAETLY